MAQNSLLMTHDVDLLILGGGCAGLSLAWRLAALGAACPKTLILEQRALYSNDRTWCFWDNHDIRLDGLMTHEWRWLQLTWLAKTVRFDCGQSAYQMLAASSFYDRALRAIGDCSAITLAQSQPVTLNPRVAPPAGPWRQTWGRSRREWWWTHAPKWHQQPVVRPCGNRFTAMRCAATPTCLPLKRLN